MSSSPSILLKVRRLFEAGLVLSLYGILRILPFSWASAFIGKLIRWLGPLHPSHQTALKNLAFCFPEKSRKEINALALDSWENIGRTAGELPHITSYSDDKIKELCPISGAEHLEEILEYSKKTGLGLMFISCHIANWELASRMLLVLDKDLALIYRKANNPYVEKLIQKLRGRYIKFIIPKGHKAGVKDIVKHLKAGRKIGMLADQKMNEGITVEFFGKKTKAPALAGEFAEKYDIGIITGRIIRDEKNKTSFVLKLEKPIYANGRNAIQITQEIYDRYESWIKLYPGQWFWQHNRFNLTKK